MIEFLYTEAGRLILAALIGLILGLERELRGSYAGVRTHALVCVGSALISIVSLTFPNDPVRLAAGIITGIGFLGAGAIFRSESQVIGLTTAANLWVAAAIGLAIGLNQIEAGVIAFVLVFIILIIRPKKVEPIIKKELEEKIFKKNIESHD